jgi:hypothetical protein
MSREATMLTFTFIKLGVSAVLFWRATHNARDANFCLECAEQSYGMVRDRMLRHCGEHTVACVLQILSILIIWIALP